MDGNLLTAETSTYFYHTDHLGSTVLVTNERAENVWNSEYKPFGSITMEEGEYGFQKGKKFTGKDLNEDTGLYYYNTRWYDAEIGRFTSADTYKGELVNPQTLNLYIYTMNNPLIYVDPSGNFSEKLDGEYGTIEKGDTLISISNETGISIDSLLELNPNIKDKDIIYADDSLRLREEPLFKIFSRSEWGAREVDYNNMELSIEFNNITVHNSGRRGISNPPKIQNMHIDEFLFADVGYHFMIDKDGSIYEGRSLKYKGSHVNKDNTGRIGINVLGDFEPSPILQPFDFINEEPTTVQIKRLNLLIEKEV